MAIQFTQIQVIQLYRLYTVLFIAVAKIFDFLQLNVIGSNC